MNITEKINSKFKNIYFDFVSYLIQKNRIQGFDIYLKLARHYKIINGTYAYRYFARCLGIKPDDPDLNAEFAQFLTDYNELEKSLLICKRTLMKNENHTGIMLVLCQNYLIHQDFNKAIEWGKKVLEIDDKSTHACRFIIEAYKNLGNEEEILKYVDKWNKIKGVNFTCSEDDRICGIWEDLFRRKKFTEGIKVINKLFSNIDAYRAGKSKILYTYMDLPKSIEEYFKHFWQYEDLKGKKFFVCCIPCGYGDFIMYSRYFNVVKQRAKQVTVEIFDDLYDLFKYSFPNIKVIKASEKEYKDYDYTSSYELLLRFSNSFDDIPYAQGYLNAAPKHIKKMKNTGIFETKKKKVGIFWRSHSSYNEMRTIKTEDIIPILENQNCQFYSLQKDELDEETNRILEKYGVVMCNKYIKNTHDTAAIMKNLDLVISIDSFPIHLAGALGVKSWLLLPYYTEWRWFFDDKTTPWYNSVKIFRQTEPDNWQNVSKRVAKELNNLE